MISKKSGRSSGSPPVSTTTGIGLASARARSTLKASSLVSSSGRRSLIASARQCLHASPQARVSSQYTRRGALVYR